MSTQPGFGDGAGARTSRKIARGPDGQLQVREARPQPVDDGHQTLGLADLPLDTEPRDRRARQETEPERKRTRDLGRDDVARDDELPQARRRARGQRGERARAERQVRERERAQRGARRGEREQVRRGAEGREDEGQRLDAPERGPQPLVRRRAGRAPVREHDGQRAQAAEARQHAPEGARARVAGALRGRRRRRDELERAHVRRGAGGVVVRRERLLLAAVDRERVVQVVARAREPGPLHERAGLECGAVVGEAVDDAVGDLLGELAGSLALAPTSSAERRRTHLIAVRTIFLAVSSPTEADLRRSRDKRMSRVAAGVVGVVVVEERDYLSAIAIARRRCLSTHL